MSAKAENVPCTDNLHAALALARRSFAVFPIWYMADGRCACGGIKHCKAGKHPIGKLAPHGFKNATTDATTIKRWWSECPNANIGVETGAVSGTWALDIDVKHDVDGEKRYAVS
jgi:putative DNA primase/helicase